MRYRADTSPALLGVSFDIPAGALVAINGPIGAGKSTILKLILGLYLQQAGTVAIDGFDVRQIDPRELRTSLGYVPQRPSFFYGTIAQNLLLAHPTADQDDLIRAAGLTGVLDDILALPEGFSTSIGDYRVRHLPAGFLNRLALARAYLKNPAILLLDEPDDALDQAGDRCFMDYLRAEHGQRSIVMATPRPSHMREADQIISLERGLLVSMPATSAPPALSRSQG